jgi:HlyD family secretion protein
MIAVPTRPPVRLAVVPFAGLLLVLAGCGARDPGAIHASGQVEATEVRVATKVPGTVSKLAVEEGDVVAQGAVLAVLDTVDLALARGQAKGDLGQAQANLALLTAGSRAEDVRAARAEVDLRRADLDGAQKTYDRVRPLVERGLSPQQSLDDALVRRDVARSALAAAEQSLARLEHGARPEEIAAARAALARAQARWEATDQQIKDCSVLSPLAGVVTSKLTESGEYVTAGTGLVVVSDLARPWLTVFVGGADLPRVHVGQAALVTTDAKGDRPREGRVIYVSPTAEFTPRNVQTRDERTKLVYRVKILLANQDGAFKAGMPADAVIQAGPAAAR